MLDQGFFNPPTISHLRFDTLALSMYSKAGIWHYTGNKGAISRQGKPARHDIYMLCRSPLPCLLIT